MSAKSKLFAQMKEKKELASKASVKESVVATTAEERTSDDTSVNTPTPASGSGDMGVSVGVGTGAPDCVGGFADMGVGGSEYDEYSALTFGDISVFANENVNVRDLKSKITKNKKVKFEERHVKRTLWISKENNDILDIWRENGGNITKDVNSAIRLLFNLKSKGLFKSE